MQFKDYYQTMGVSESATPEEIKHAYRRLARKYHPDVSKEKDAEAKFKEVGEAYEVLKDPEKRTAYNQLRQSGWRGGESFTPPPDWQYQRSAGRPGAQHADFKDFGDFFSELFGQSRGQRGAAGPSYSFRQQGEDVHYTLPVSLKMAYTGGNQSIQLTTPEHDERGHVKEKVRALNVKIPAGITNGQQIRLKGQGGPGYGGGENGDLYLTIHIKPDHLYHLHGKDVSLNLPIAPWEAALGAKVITPTLGGNVTVKIPPNSQSGNKIRLSGRGLPGHPPGDQYVILQIVVPPANTEQAKKLYEEMAQTIQFNPREHLEV